MTLKLYNTLTKTKEVFTPLDPQNVRLYVCGPTVYDFAHIGNARPVVVFDVLFRMLRHVYGENHVKYVRNITDVDDKINARAAERGVSIRDLTEETYANFRADTLALGCLPPSVEPRATEHIAQMISMIERLIAAGHAYAANGHVLFDVASKPDYGKLARRSLDEMVAGARVDVAPYKKSPMDFVLWKPSTEDLPGWDSPWGRGRPGWHIECSAMSECHLGETFDIHGGGIDLVFPHHENEIAQSEGAHHGHKLANIWMHNGFLQVEGQKMSKSLGNFVTIRELLTDWNGYGWPGEALRFNLLRTHYRQPVDWTLDGLDETHKILWDWYARLEGVKPAEEPPAAVLNALEDDLNTVQAITELHGIQEPESLLAALQYLGFSGRLDSIRRSLGVQAAQTLPGVSTQAHGAVLDQAAIETLIAARAAARKAKNFAESDRIRDELDKMGVLVKDGPQGTNWELKR